MSCHSNSFSQSVLEVNYRKRFNNFPVVSIDQNSDPIWTRIKNFFSKINFCSSDLWHVIHIISEGIDSTTTVRCWYTVWWKTKWRLRIFSIPHFLSRIKSLIVFFSIFEQILNSNSSDLSFVDMGTWPQFFLRQQN